MARKVSILEAEAFRAVQAQMKFCWSQFCSIAMKTAWFTDLTSKCTKVRQKKPVIGGEMEVEDVLNIFEAYLGLINQVQSTKM